MDSPQNIAKKYPHKLWSISASNNYKLLRAINNYEKKKSAFAFGNSVHLATDNEIEIEEIQNYLKSIIDYDFEIKPIEPNIEDAFMELMKEE